MGKINTYRGVEVIPVNSHRSDPQSSTPNTSALSLLQLGDARNMNRLPYIADRSLIQRVQRYLESNVDKTYISINDMADELQRTCREYTRRKKNAFRGAVKKAYTVVMQNYGNDQDVTSSDDTSDITPADEGEDGTHYESLSNSQITDMYARNLQKPVDSHELIDISSDESDDGTSEPKQSANGQVFHQHSMLPADLVETEMLRAAERAASRPYNIRGKKRKADHSIPFTIPKRKKTVASIEESYVTFKDVGGMDHKLVELCELLVHMRYPQVHRRLGLKPPRGILLHGPPGCGKTLLAHAIAGELEIPLLNVSAPELVAGISGGSEERIRELFEKAAIASPCVLFIDEIDAVMLSQQNAQGMERRIVAQLRTCLDGLGKSEMADQVLVIGATNRPDSLDPSLRRAGRFDREICLGIPDLEARQHILKVVTVKAQLEEGFSYETIAKYTPGYVGADLVELVGTAGRIAAKRVFTVLKEKRRLEEAIAIQKLQEAKNKALEALEESKVDSEEVVVDVETPDKKEEKELGGEGSDQVVIIDDDVKEKPPQPTTSAVNNQEKNIETNEAHFELPPKTPLEEALYWLHNDILLVDSHLNDVNFTMDDFALALKRVQPSAKREGFATVPDTTWDDVGSLIDIRHELKMAILAPVRHHDQYEKLGMTIPTGILLCGPPGCGKTLLAKAIANEAGINFISVRGPELLNMYVGESERAVRTVFTRARNSAPCVIFFDEFDSLCPKRSVSGENGASVRVVHQLLTEMDGIEGRKDVYILAASNRPDIIDPAVLRPGRLGTILYVGLPTPSDRVDILRTVTKGGTKPMLAPDVDLEIIGKSNECEGYTGADLAALVRQATTEALTEMMLAGNDKVELVTTEHFKAAVAKIRPSVNEKDKQHYENLKKLYGRKSQQNEVEEMEYS